MIQLEQVQVRPRGVAIPVLTGLDLQVAPGEVVGIVGPSGSGKSLLLQLLSGERRGQAGRVLIDDVQVDRLPGAVLQMYRQRIGIVFQEPRLVAHLTLVENVALPLELAGADPHLIGERLEDVLAALDLVTAARAFPHALTGSQRRLACLARALVGRPRIIFLDEPFDGLDAAQEARARALLQQHHAHGATLLIATRNADALAGLGGRTLHLRDGHLEGASPALEQQRPYRILERTLPPDDAPPEPAAHIPIVDAAPAPLSPSVTSENPPTVVAPVAPAALAPAFSTPVPIVPLSTPIVDASAPGIPPSDAHLIGKRVTKPRKPKPAHPPHHGKGRVRITGS